MKIIYVYDALCGWCYGFSPVMEAFHQKHRDEFAFEVVSGGMITGSRIGRIGEVAPYIKQAYKEVENRTGVRFGEAFLNDVLEEGSTVFTSVPLGVAMSVLKSHQPRQAVAFAGRLQQAVYYDGLAPQDTDAYGPLAEEFGLNGADFVAQMAQPEFQQAAQQDFQRTQQLGVTGFPTVLAEVNETYYRLVSGYVPLTNLEQQLESLLAQTR